MELSKDELEQILTEVTKEYEEVVKSEKSKLEKSALPMNKEESSESSEESSKPETSKAEDPMPEGSSEKIEKADDDMAAPEAEAAPEQAAPEAEPVQEEPAQAEDMGGDELLQLYSGLSPEHLAAHWMACSQALFQSMQGESPDEMVADVGAGEPEVEAAPAAPEAPAAPAEDEPPMFKAEDTKEFKELKKNFDELKSQNANLEKSLGTLTEKLSEKLRIPARKGIDADTVISKSESVVEEKVISKSEVVDLLKSKAKGPLSDQDKQKIFKFTMNPTVTPELKEFLGLK
jgi:hypothetical protein